jgi:hypothetical protein
MSAHNLVIRMQSNSMMALIENNQVDLESLVDTDFRDSISSSNDRRRISGVITITSASEISFSQTACCRRYNYHNKPYAPKSFAFRPKSEKSEDWSLSEYNWLVE